MAKKTGKRSECPVSCSLDIWGDKWSLLIIRDLMFRKKNTYGEFLKSPEGIATNILASRLVQLEEAKIITHMEHPDSKLKIFYKLTQKGIELMPLMLEIYLWSEKNLKVPEDILRLIKKAKVDKEGMIKSLSLELKQLKP